MSTADNAVKKPAAKAKGLRQAMAGLHTWGGLLPSWLLFVILMGGSIACFDKELEVWMRPGLHAVGEHQLTADQVSTWLLSKSAPRTPHALWMRPPDDRQPFWLAGYEPSELEPFVSFALDPQTGEALPETL
ncbi:MAG: PepSY-associated TM helix domain-containing protein, partial [Pseudomonas sp.]